MLREYFKPNRKVKFYLSEENIQSRTNYQLVVFQWHTIPLKYRVIGVKNGETILDETKTTSSNSDLRVTFDAGQVCDKILYEIELPNESSVAYIQWKYLPNFTIDDINSISNMTNLTGIETHWNTPFPMPESVFLCEKLQTLIFKKAVNITNIDARLAGLLNLTKLELKPNLQGQYNTAILLQMPNLKSLDLSSLNASTLDLSLIHI